MRSCSAALLAAVLVVGCGSGQSGSSSTSSAQNGGGGGSSTSGNQAPPARGPIGTWASSTPVSIVVVTACTQCADATFNSICTTALPTATEQWSVTLALSPGSDASHVQGTLEFTSGSAAAMLRDCGITRDNANRATPVDFFQGLNLTYQITGSLGSAQFLGLTDASGMSEGSFNISGTTMTGTFTRLTETGDTGYAVKPVYHTEPSAFTLTLQP